MANPKQQPDLSALEMPHLAPDAELAQRAKERLEVQKNEEASEDEEVPIEKSIDFSYTDARGKVWSGQFVNRVLSIAQRQEKAILESQFNGGQPYHSINDLQAAINHALAHMAISLKKRPKWAESLRSLHDHNVVLALFEEVVSHENKFLGREPRAEESQTQE